MADEETNPSQNTSSDTGDGSGTNGEAPDEVAIGAGITKDEARLTLLQEDFTTAADKMHDDFESILEANPSTLFSEEELETLASDSNISAKNKMLRDKYETFRDEKLNGKKDEISKFEKELDGRKGEFDILSQSNKFSKDNPSVDMEVLAAFIQGDLTPNEKRNFLEKTETKYDFLKLAYEEYKKQNPSENEDDNLPPDLSGVNSASGDSDFTSDIKMEAYRRQIGAS